MKKIDLRMFTESFPVVSSLSTIDTKNKNSTSSFFIDSNLMNQIKNEIVLPNKTNQNQQNF